MPATCGKACPLPFGFFGLKNPETNGVEFFTCNALPFGASAAVHGFNRAASAIEAVLVQIFGVPCTHYFDDFTCVVPGCLAKRMLEIAKGALDRLGWSVKDDKDLPWSQSFTAIGVVFDKKEMVSDQPSVIVSNKLERVRELVSDITRYLDNSPG